MSQKREVFISVDVETAGPIPGEYSLLSIGACRVDDDTEAFS
jgi:ribonuclease T